MAVHHPNMIMYSCEHAYFSNPRISQHNACIFIWLRDCNELANGSQLHTKCFRLQQQQQAIARPAPRHSMRWLLLRLSHLQISLTRCRILLSYYRRMKTAVLVRTSHQYFLIQRILSDDVTQSRHERTNVPGASFNVRGSWCCCCACR